MRRRPRAWCFLPAVVAVVAAVGGCASDTKQDTRKGEGAAVPASPVPSDPAALARLAKQRGAGRCLPRIQELASHLLEGASYRADVVEDPAHPGARLFAAMISRQGPQGAHEFVSLTVAPDAACSSTFAITTAWGMPCEQVAAQAFAHSRPAARLSGKVAVLQLDVALQVYLMPIPGGCLSLEKRAIY